MDFLTTILTVILAIGFIGLFFGLFINGITLIFGLLVMIWSAAAIPFIWLYEKITGKNING